MNQDIMQAFFSTLSSANLGYPIAWPNVPFTPPNSGTWLEVSHFPNRGIDNSIAGQQVIRQGIFQVSVLARQNIGVFDLEQVAAQVAAVFPKLTPLANVKVSRVPYTTAALSISDGRVELPLTIEYTG